MPEVQHQENFILVSASSGSGSRSSTNSRSKIVSLEVSSSGWGSITAYGSHLSELCCLGVLCQLAMDDLRNKSADFRGAHTLIFDPIQYTGINKYMYSPSKYNLGGRLISQRMQTGLDLLRNA